MRLLQVETLSRDFLLRRLLTLAFISTSRGTEAPQG